MSLEFCSLTSGSCGNVSVIRTDKVCVLIDLGCSQEYLLKNLSDLKVNPSNINAVLLTHAHSDHMSAAGFSLICKNNIPLYLHRDVFDDLSVKFKNKIELCNSRIFDDEFNVGGIAVRPFAVSHKDARISKTFGFTLKTRIDGRVYKIGYMTDTGKVSEAVKEVLADSNLLFIEANYDPKLLDMSFRYAQNKNWISGNFGHLENSQAAIAICDIKEMSCSKDSLKYVFLAHLSGEHNTRALALDAVQKEMEQRNISGVSLLIAPRMARGQIVKLG
jgi:phosphoribosyl 1,2-cyclic phosphodiesterase